MASDHTVKEGDTLISIAHAHGFRDWRSIWDHAGNAALRGKRANPQVLYAGDVVHVPDPDPRAFRASTERRHTYKLKKLQAYFSVRLVDETGRPFADKRYVLSVGKDRFDGVTSADGWLSHAVDPTVSEGELTLFRSGDGDSFAWKVKIGHLDPVSEVSGVKARLKNLGYKVAEVDGNLDADTRAALKEFQQNAGLPSPSGEIDEPTRAALERYQNHL